MRTACSWDASLIGRSAVSHRWLTAQCVRRSACRNATVGLTVSSMRASGHRRWTAWKHELASSSSSSSLASRTTLARKKWNVQPSSATGAAVAAAGDGCGVLTSLDGAADTSAEMPVRVTSAHSDHVSWRSSPYVSHSHHRSCGGAVSLE